VTIKRKLILMGLVVVLVLAGMAGTVYFRSHTVLNDLLHNAGLEIVKSAANNIDMRLDKIDAVVKTSAESVRNTMILYGASDEDQVEEITTALTNVNKENGIVNVFMGHESNGRFSDGGGWVEPEDYDCRTRSWYKEGVAAKGDIVMTSPYVDGITKMVIVSVVKAIYDNSGNLLGVVGADFDLGGLVEHVQHLTVLGHGEGLLLGDEGLVIAGARKENNLVAYLTKDEKFPEGLRNIGKRMIAGETGSDSYAMDGVEKQMFFSSTQHGMSLGILFPVSEINAIIRALTVTLSAIALVALVVVVFVVFIISRGLSRSIYKMKVATERLGAGDLTAIYDDSGRDEIAEISHVLNVMASSLREVMKSIRHEAEETGRHSENLASLSEETLSSMEEVTASIEKVQDMVNESASALEETNASVEEIASGAQSTARASSEGAEEASQATEAAGSSLTEVNQAIENIKNATVQSNNAIEKIKALEGSVQDISGFVTTITTIADQTNLLALNAAIEAARAGEAGRGFAVVAEEVRKLAEESAQAANEVNKLIDGLQRHSGDSIIATEKTGEILKDTLKGAEETQKKLNAAVMSIAKMAESVQDVAAVSQEQAASSEEMTSVIQGVTTSTSYALESVKSIQLASVETSRAAEVIAEEAQEMALAAQALSSMVARFKIEDENGKGIVPVNTRQ